MTEKNSCCSFLSKICNKLCRKTKKDTIKPENPPQIITRKFVQQSLRPNQEIPPEEKFRKSKIITGALNQPISSTQLIKYVEPEEIHEENLNQSFNNRTQIDQMFFYDCSKEQESNINRDNLVANLDEAYKIIQEASPIDKDSESQEKFTKVIKGFNFKDMLAGEI